MVSTVRMVRVLGGKDVFPHAPRDHDAIIAQVRSGLPYSALEAIAARFAIPREELLRILHVPLRTLARRKKERRLRADESDRLLRLGRVAALAEEALGSRGKAVAWLRKPNKALGGALPLDRLDTDLGTQQVEHVLLRAAHGVYS